ncbi:hypothetical protein N7475_010485 [Penicillium sp. IBT 31633x]|nr:hypothetical protein N7475_010485 [Penicillium sp. IBT 31633x]
MSDTSSALFVDAEVCRMGSFENGQFTIFYRIAGKVKMSSDPEAATCTVTFPKTIPKDRAGGW